MILRVPSVTLVLKLAAAAAAAAVAAAAERMTIHHHLPQAVPPRPQRQTVMSIAQLLPSLQLPLLTALLQPATQLPNVMRQPQPIHLPRPQQPLAQL